MAPNEVMDVSIKSVGPYNDLISSSGILPVKIYE
jgi:hypothetical protein